MTRNIRFYERPSRGADDSERKRKQPGGGEVENGEFIVSIFLVRKCAESRSSTRTFQYFFLPRGSPAPRKCGSTEERGEISANKFHPSSFRATANFDD